MELIENQRESLQLSDPLVGENWFKKNPEKVTSYNSSRRDKTTEMILQGLIELFGEIQ